MGLQTSGGGGDSEKAGPKLLAARRALRRLLRCLVACLSKSLDYVDVCVKWLGPAFIILALSLFAFQTYVFFRYILPRIRDAGASLAWTVFLAVTGVFVLFNMLYNYGMAICVSPGRPPLYGESDLSLNADTELGEDSAPKQCQKCLRQKPPRTHHCSVCGQCVLKMDHHCPWINNCVGFRNYRHFCLFLWYLAGCCAFVSVVFWDAFIMSIWHPRRSRLPRFARQSVSLCWIIAFCILLAAGVLGGFHLYLVLSNQTTIEYHSNRSNKDKARRKGELFRNPYDLGRRRNFQQVFGPHAVCGGCWMLPCLARGPSGDGMHFPSAMELRA